MLNKIWAVSLLLIASPALAADLSYNYLQFGYQWIEFDDDLVPGLDIDGDGFGIGGSVEINENWFLVAQYSQADFDFGVDADTIELGGGYHAALNDNVDLFGTLSYVRAEVSASGFGSADEDGIGVSAGLRGMIGERFELTGALGYVDLGDGGDSTTFNAGALYSFTDNVAGGFFLDIDEDFTGYGIGVRFYFDK